MTALLNLVTGLLKAGGAIECSRGMMQSPESCLCGRVHDSSACAMPSCLDQKQVGFGAAWSDH